MGPTKGPNGFSTILNQIRGILNLAGKRGQLTFEAEQRGPRDLSHLLQYFSAYRSSNIDDHRTKCRFDVDQWGS